MFLRWNREASPIFCTIIFILFFCSACDGGTAQYTPPFGLIDFSISDKGISVNADAKLVTPIGEFSYQYPLASTSVDDGTLMVDIRYNKGGVITDSVYQIKTNNDEVIVTTNGQTVIHISNQRVLIDASAGNIQSVEVRDAQSVDTSTTSPIETIPSNPPTQPPLTPEKLGQSVIDSYYTAINNKDYQAAYNLWQNYQDSYQTFASGFSDTTYDDYHIDTISQLGDGTVQVYITLVATSTSSVQTTYKGYYIVGQQSDGTWKITGASVYQA